MQVHDRYEVVQCLFEKDTSQCTKLMILWSSGGETYEHAAEHTNEVMMSPKTVGRKTNRAGNGFESSMECQKVVMVALIQYHIEVLERLKAGKSRIKVIAACDGLNPDLVRKKYTE